MDFVAQLPPLVDSVLAVFGEPVTLEANGAPAAELRAVVKLGTEIADESLYSVVTLRISDVAAAIPGLASETWRWKVTGHITIRGTRCSIVGIGSLKFDGDGTVTLHCRVS